MILETSALPAALYLKKSCDGMNATLENLPNRIDRPSAWVGTEMAADHAKWLYHLTSAEVEDLENAARHYLGLSRDIGEISSTDFPLGRFSGHLQQLKEKLLHGVGVEVIRGLPIGNYSQEFVATIFCGIGAHLGSARSQNAQGHILGHVRDTGAAASDVNTRIYQTSERQTFHTDSADVVGLLCIREAMEGGKSLLVSVETIYNRMRQERPDLLPLLFETVATDRRGEVPEGARPFFEIPVLSWHAGLLTAMYQRQYINSGQRFPDARRLTERHVEALDYFDKLANDPEIHFSMQLEAGDIQFVYNHSQLHDRTGYTDWTEAGKRRHLFRLWLSIDGDRALPSCFEQRYGSIEVGNRGGIVTSQTTLHAPLD